jgi:hypothetical protein
MRNERKIECKIILIKLITGLELGQTFKKKISKIERKIK